MYTWIISSQWQIIPFLQTEELIIIWVNILEWQRGCDAFKMKGNHSFKVTTILASTGIKRQRSWWCNYSSTLPVVTKANKTSLRDAWKNSIENWSVLLELVYQGLIQNCHSKQTTISIRQKKEKTLKCQNISGLYCCQFKPEYKIMITWETSILTAIVQ